MENIVESTLAHKKAKAGLCGKTNFLFFTAKTRYTENKNIIVKPIEYTKNTFGVSYFSLVKYATRSGVDKTKLAKRMKTEVFTCLIIIV